MHRRGMTAYETTVALLVIALLIAGISSVAASQFTTSRKFFSNAAIEKSTQEIYRKAELLPSGSQDHARIFIPANVSNVRIEPEGDEWALRLTIDGREYRKTSGIKLVFLPANLLETPGVHRVIIRKESEKSAVLIKTQ